MNTSVSMRVSALILQGLMALSIVSALGVDDSPSELLTLGDAALSSDDLPAAVETYEKAIGLLSEDTPLATALSLYTNLGTAVSSIGDNEKAVDSYRKALLLYSESVEKIDDKILKEEVTDLAAQAAFFLGMTEQEIGNPQKAADAYAFSNSLDPNHWASLANLGAVLQDNLQQTAEALDAFNKAFEILVNENIAPTDPPNEPRYILSQLQYRIGLAINHDPKKKCALRGDATNLVSCKQMATHAFDLAVKYDPSNEAAKQMLLSMTADATMDQASSEYVTALFDGYAPNFEQSLVSELGYNGYERLRQGFDRAFGGGGNVPMFRLVVDAGCGTGLAGEQFRNISEHLVGVDLSEAIVKEGKKARPGLYDEIIIGDVVEILQTMKPIPLIIAADSFIYFGDLEPLFRSMKEGLGDGGYVAFTLENVSEDSEESLNEMKPDWRWQLTPSGRFAHRKEYVQFSGEKNSMRLFHYEPLDDFRRENGVGVRGHLFLMQKIRQTDEL